MKPLNTNPFKPLFAILAVALSCVCMWGCGDLLREDGEKEFTGHYIKGNAKVVGFIDDSLVIVYDFQYWNQDLADGTQITGTGKQRLRVFNYRVQEDGPRWADTLDNMTEVYDYVRGQLSDSVIWGGNGRNTFSFWKLGEEPVAYGVSINKEGCDVDYSVRALRPWLNGDIIALGEETINADGNSCQYAILDTTAKTITYKRLDKDLEWIKQCDDVRALKNKIYCLRTMVHTDQIGHLIVNNEDQGLLEINAAIGPFWGDMLELGNNLCKISDNGLNCLSTRWLGGVEIEYAKFVDEKGECVYLRN
ncbi:MAG: hypothetical protein IJ912_08585 [Fibrobacter sp.]|nr:hypothetical protein [Fibrobacter sp.]